MKNSGLNISSFNNGSLFGGYPSWCGMIKRNDYPSTNVLENDNEG